MLLYFELVLHFAAIVITFWGDYYILLRNTMLRGFFGKLIFANFCHYCSNVVRKSS